MKFLILPIFLVLTACNYYLAKQEASSVPESKMGSDSLIGFDLVQSKVLNSCAHCHASQQRPIFNNLNQVKAHLAKIQDEIETNSMPPTSQGYAPLSNCQKAILKKWVEVGSPETTKVAVSTIPECGGASGSGEPSLAESPLTYQTLLTKVLQPRCLSCHNPQDSSDAAGILFFPYSEWISHKPTLLTKPAANSKLLRVLTRTDEERMPPPEAGDPLSDEQIQFLLRYIDSDSPQ